MTQEFKYDDDFPGLGSSVIKHVYFDSETGQMAVHLHNSYTYVYQNVEQETFLDFSDAVSPGNYYNANVRNVLQRNGYYTTFTPVEFVPREAALTVVPEPENKISTEFVLSVNGYMRVKLDGDVSADDFMDSFNKQFDADVMVSSRIVTQTF